MPVAYMPLLDEGVDVWRPVELLAQPDGSLIVDGQQPGDERWAYPAGSRVVVGLQTMDDGEVASVITGVVE